MDIKNAEFYADFKFVDAKVISKRPGKNVQKCKVFWRKKLK